MQCCHELLFHQLNIAEKTKPEREVIKEESRRLTGVSQGVFG
jgi:hypothetical protein